MSQKESQGNHADTSESYILSVGVRRIDRIIQPMEMRERATVTRRNSPSTHSNRALGHVSFGDARCAVLSCNPMGFVRRGLSSTRSPDCQAKVDISGKINSVLVT